MAVPALSANTPASGQIQWAAFTIQYAGQSYPIASGYTSNKFVWWRWNNGAGGPLQAADTQPVLGPDDLLLFLNKSGTPINTMSVSIIDGSIIATESIIGDAIAANTITGTKMLADSISAREIAANAITATEIQAGGITADWFAVGTIVADLLGASQILAGHIAADQISTNHLTVDAVQAGNIAAGAVEAGKIAAGAVTAETIDAMAIAAEKISGGSLSADVAVVGSLIARNFTSGEEVSLSGDGFLVRGPDSEGNPTHVEFPTQGGKPNIIGGELNATTLSVSTGTTLRGTSSIEAESVIELASRVNAPKTAPLVTETWASVALDMTAPDGTVFAAVVGHFVRGPNGNMWGCVSPTTFSDGGTHIAEWNWDTGELLSIRVPPGTGPVGKYRGLAYGGGFWYVLVAGEWEHDVFIDTYDSSWVKLAGNKVRNAADRNNTEEAIGWSHTDSQVIFGYCSGSKVNRTRYSTSAGGVLTAQGSWNSGTDPYGNSALGFIGRGSFDYGATRNIYMTAWLSQGDNFRVCGEPNGSTSTAAEEWPRAEWRHIHGACWDTTTSRFYSVAADNRRYTYLGGEAMWTSGTSKWWIGSTFVDSTEDPTATPPDTTHETDLSPTRSWTKAKRAGFTTTINAIPVADGGPARPDKAGVWLAKSTTTPAAADFTLRVDISAPATTWVWTGQGPSIDVGTGAPITGAPTENTFPFIDPGSIRSTTARADGKPPTEINGDGTGRFDGLLPPGSVTMFAGATVPAGWLLCNGQTVNRVDYPDLYAALGGDSSPFGVNVAAGTFTLPDFTDRFPMGASASKARGTKGGAATTNVDARHVPPHEHDMTHDHPTSTTADSGTHGHTKNWRDNATSFGPQTNVAAAGGTTGTIVNKNIADLGGQHSHTVNILTSNKTSTGDGSGGGLGQDPLDVLNPYAALNFIIRT